MTQTLTCLDVLCQKKSKKKIKSYNLCCSVLFCIAASGLELPATSNSQLALVISEHDTDDDWVSIAKKLSS